jgi:hypothetical protein
MSLNTAPIDDSWLQGDIQVQHIGFGVTRFQGNDGGTKRKVIVPMVGYSGEPPDGNWGVSFFDASDGRSTCQGDSGGPGVVREGNDGYFQVGVTSYGIACGSGIGTKMRVDPYIDWILGREDGANDDGVVTEDEYLDDRPEETRVPFVQTGAAGPPKFECSHQIAPASGSSFALGTVPLDLRCSTTIPDPDTLESITWYWGDGSAPQELTTDREQAEHTYTVLGVYNVRACFAGVRGEQAYDQCVRKTSYVNACDVPDVHFEAEQTDDLTIGVRNLTSLRAHNCVTNAVWELYKGTSASGDFVEYAGWEPEITIEEAGDYTLVLNVGGLAGTGGATASLNVTRRAGGCTSAAMAPAFGSLALLPLLAFRRRHD